MPYIKKIDRNGIDNGTCTPHTAGELNYAITKLLITYLRHNKECYQSINDVVGALECAKLEFQRRIIGKYEDSKIVENSDVY